MPSLKATLTNTLCKETEPDPSGDIIIWDSQVNGLFFKITKSGGRSFGLFYRNREGKQRKPKIGNFGPFKVPSARRQAEDWLAIAHQGGDPSLQKQSARVPVDKPTVRDLATRYLADHVNVKRKDGQSRDNDKILLRLHILPAIGDMPVDEVDYEHVFRLHRNMQERYVVNGNRALACMSKMFNLAELWKMRPDGSNPCRFVQLDPEEGRERDLADWEWTALSKALDEYERYQIGNPAICWLIRLVIFTGTRRSEIMTARLDQIDPTRQILTIGDHKSATTRRTNRRRRKDILLNDYAMLIIKDRLDHPDWKDNPWLIPGKPGTNPDGTKHHRHMVSPKKAWGKIKEMAGIEDLTIRDLRHVFATEGVDNDVSLDMIQKLLGHAKPDTTLRYAHRKIDAQRKTQQQIADAIAARLSTGKK
ncbi:MAG: site-specific integrase [Rhodospirillales bacterium]|nr:site-specific integrase [Rhodospirillales bacterium]MBR9819062.1 site-specific integrase [Rhodospirillales bacterium]